MEKQTIRTHTDRGVPYAESFTGEYAQIPAHIQDGLVNYATRGVVPGQFLSLVLRGDIHAVLVADDASFAALHQIVLWAANNLPAVAWGSPVAVRLWQAAAICRPEEEAATPV